VIQWQVDVANGECQQQIEVLELGLHTNSRTSKQYGSFKPIPVDWPASISNVIAAVNTFVRFLEHSFDIVMFVWWCSLRPQSACHVMSRFAHRIQHCWIQRHIHNVMSIHSPNIGFIELWKYSKKWLTSENDDIIINPTTYPLFSIVDKR